MRFRIVNLDFSMYTRLFRRSRIRRCRCRILLGCVIVGFAGCVTHRPPPEVDGPRVLNEIPRDSLAIANRVVTSLLVTSPLHRESTRHRIRIRVAPSPGESTPTRVASLVARKLGRSTHIVVLAADTRESATYILTFALQTGSPSERLLTVSLYPRDTDTVLWHYDQPLPE